MLLERDRLKIQEISEKYRAKRVLLFGSAVDGEHESRDIDLAVEGVAPARFFSFYGDLILALSKPVDLVDLDRHSRFNDIVRQEGVPVYG